MSNSYVRDVTEKGNLKGAILIEGNDFPEQTGYNIRLTDQEIVVYNAKGEMQCHFSNVRTAMVLQLS